MPSAPLPSKVLTICFFMPIPSSMTVELTLKEESSSIWSLDYFPKQASLWKPILLIIRQKILPSSHLMPDLRRPKILLVFCIMIIFLGANHKAGLFLGLRPFWFWISSISLPPPKVLKNSQHFFPRYYYLRILSLLIYSDYINLLKKRKWKWNLLSDVQLFVTPWIIVCQAPLSMEDSRPEYWSG